MRDQIEDPKGPICHLDLFTSAILFHEPRPVSIGGVAELGRGAGTREDTALGEDKKSEGGDNTGGDTKARRGAGSRGGEKAGRDKASRGVAKTGQDTSSIGGSKVGDGG